MSDDMRAAVSYEDECLPPPPLTYAEWGTVGWEDSADVYFDAGDDSNDGNLLVRVQLFEGRAPGVAIKPGQGQGVQLLCTMSSAAIGVHRVPPKGTKVVVLIPGGDITSPGNCIIVAALEKNPTNQFGEKRVKWDLGPDTDLTIKARSVTVTDYGNRMISTGPDGGVQLFDETGSGFQVNSGAAYVLAAQNATFIVQSNGSVKASINLDNTGLAAVGNTAGVVKLTPDGTYTVATGTFVAATTICMLGNTATAASFALYMKSGAPFASKSVWIGV